MLIIWGKRDSIIPVSHGESAHEAIPGSRLEVFEDVGHMPQIEAPAEFVDVLGQFLGSTEPAQWDTAQWRARIGLAEM